MRFLKNPSNRKFSFLKEPIQFNFARAQRTTKKEFYNIFVHTLIKISKDKKRNCVNILVNYILFI